MIDRTVHVYTERQTYPTKTDVTFLAVTDVPEPLEFLWNFGDSTSTRTSSGNVTKRYDTPGRYNIRVVICDGRASLTSGVLTVLIQRAVKLNKLFHQAYVLRNRTSAVSCRVNSGTDVTFLWSFGDGTTRMGQSSERHVFRRTGEFLLEVTASNRVSWASLSSIIFVLDHPCRPPPVKNMGPRKLQVRRHNAIRLGVSYEADIECDVMRGVRYTWTLFDSAGHIWPVSDAHKQNLQLPAHLLHYHTYIAMARVQVVGSLVYSNYSVRVQVIPSRPVASIQGGTNFFISRSIAMVTLDGQRSYNPDYPMEPISVKWTCEPVSSITTSCFSRHVATNSAVLTFPMSFLKPNFDQFHFTLAVGSGELSASTEAFVTLTPNVVGRLAVSCLECEGDQVNWDQPFSVKATCEDCEVPPKHTQYTWALHLVNASSKLMLEVPFCSTVDLSAPSAIKDTTSMLPSHLYPHPPNVSHPAYSSGVFVPKATVVETVSGASPTTNEPAGSGEDPPWNSRGDFGLLDSLYWAAAGDAAGDGDGDGSVHLGQREIGSQSPVDYDSSADWGSADAINGQDYDIPLQIAEEGDPGISAGRPTGVDVATLSPGDEPSFTPVPHASEGSNLLGSRPRQIIPKQTLIELPRDPIQAGLFASYTYTGLSSALLRVRPLSLKPGSVYMLEVIAKSASRILGRTQLFLRTKPIPKGMTCQVQPSKGVELHTHFSIFCTSGREDLLYEFSFSVGDEPPRMLYQGGNFQYYFSLPSGHPSDDYKVTVYTKISSSMYGSSTKVCPVTVRVQPSFFRDVSSHNPDAELSQTGLKNLSALILLGNNAEISNYVSLLSGILNRLSLDSQADQHTQSHMRNVLICTMCKLESRDQDSLVDNISILRDLLQVTRQVTLASVGQVVAHVKAISGQLSRASVPKRHQLDQTTLNILVAMLSYSLESAATANDVTVESTYNADFACKMASVPQDGFHLGNDISDASSVDLQTSRIQQLVENILQTASDLILKHTLFSKIQEHRVRSDGISLLMAQHNSSTSVISGDSAIFYTPAAVIHSHGGNCVLSLIAEIKHSPWTRVPFPGGISGPVVDLSLYKCSTRRKISVRSLVQPVIVEMKPRQDKKESASEYLLPWNRINYHSFNITQEHFQQAIQLSVTFTLPPERPFPIILLFRMFAKPAPSMHHLRKIHPWETNTTRITLPTSNLNAAGVGYLAFFNGDFGKPIRHKHLSSQINYTVAVESSQCLTFDRLKGAWTHLGCSAHQSHSANAVNCSCHQLRALTVAQKQIQTTYEAADLDLFVSEPADATVLVVLLLCTFLYVPALVRCRRADGISEQNRQVHYLNDNCRLDQHLYAVTIYTGLCSAYKLSAKVYLTLYGVDGISQTRELHVPGCTLFRRNSQDTFIFSAADSLGPVWGVHIWHDNSGPSPDLYLKLVEVSEVGRANMAERTWLFVSQCWLSVSKGDGQVERMLRGCTRGIRLAQMLRLTLCDYLADFHTWTSVYCCPRPHSFTRTQRLGVCLLLFAGYACVNALIVSQMDEALHFEAGVTAESLRSGVFSVVVALPMATLITFLFRVHGVKRTTEQEGTQTNQDPSEVDNMDAMKNKYQENVVTSDVNDEASEIQTEVIQKPKRRRCRRVFDGVCGKMRPNWFWCYYLAWILCLLLSVVGLLLAALLGLRFSSRKLQLWLHSVFNSLLLCIFLIQPIVIFAVAATVSIWNGKRIAFHNPSRIVFNKAALRSESCSDPQKRREQRQRARFLNRARPPTVAELRPTRARRRREALIHKTLRDLCVFVAMLLLMLCISHGSPFNDHYRLNKAIRQQFTGGRQEPAFTSIQKHEDWQKRMLSNLLHLLYKNPSAPIKADVFRQSYIVIGEPVVWITQICRKRSCDLGRSSAVSLGRTKSVATHKLKALQCDGCVVAKVQFTLYSPAPDLFTTATLLAEQSPTGAMLTSAAVHSAKVYRTTTVWVATVCQLLFLCLSLLHLWVQVGAAWRKGLTGYCAAPCNWLHVTLQISTFTYYYHDICRSVEAVEVVEMLQRSDSKEHVDVSRLAAREQHIRSLHGVLLLFLTMKCATILKMNGRSTTPLACLKLTSAFILLLIFHALLFNTWDHKTIGGLLSVRALCLTCAAVMMSTLSASGSKRRQSRNEVCTLSELGGYISRRIRELTGHEEPARFAVGSKTFYLEEFETLVDELLLRLNRLHATLTPIDHHIHMDDIPVPSIQKKHTCQDSKAIVEELQSGQLECHSVLNGARDRCLSYSNRKCSTTTQATHTKVSVEVLIHNEPL
ncbi:polycystin-1-like protein 1 [Festucalex cinctus]